MTPLPDFLRAKATERNIAANGVNELWRQHDTWCVSHGVVPGGRAWEAFLDAVVAKAARTRALSKDASARQAEAIARHSEARLAKQLADRDYDKVAISLPEWVEVMKQRGHEVPEWMAKSVRDDRASGARVHPFKSNRSAPSTTERSDASSGPADPSSEAMSDHPPLDCSDL